jgi:hypothetical protein
MQPVTVMSTGKRIPVKAWADNNALTMGYIGNEYTVSGYMSNGHTWRYVDLLQVGTGFVNSEDIQTT